MSTLFAAAALIGEALVLGGVPASYAWIDHIGIKRWEALVEAQREKGESIVFAELIDRRPLPDGQNFAAHPIFEDVFADRQDGDRRVDALSFEAITGLELRRRDDQKPTGGWQMSEKRNFSSMFETDKPEPKTTKLILRRLAKVEADLDSISAAAERPSCRFDLDWEGDTVATSANHLSSLQSLGKTYSYRASASLQRDKVDEALVSTRTAIHLAQHVERDQPTLIAHLVAVSLYSIAFQPLWEGLAEERWNEHDLVILDRALQNSNIDAHYTHTLRAERAMVSKTFIDFGEGRFVEKLDVPSQPEQIVGLSPRGIFYLNAVALSELFNVSYFDLPTYAGCEIRQGNDELAIDLIHRWRKPWRIDRVLACVSFPVFSSLRDKSLQAEAHLRMARIAIALERYKIDELEYPSRLEQLSPIYIDPLPVDPVSGNAFHYELGGEDNRPALWSEGVNGANDGGRTKRRASLGDWAWQYSVPAGHTVDEFLSRDPIGAGEAQVPDDDQQDNPPQRKRPRR